MRPPVIDEVSRTAGSCKTGVTDICIAVLFRNQSQISHLSDTGDVVGGYCFRHDAVGLPAEITEVSGFRFLCEAVRFTETPQRGVPAGRIAFQMIE